MRLRDASEAVHTKFYSSFSRWGNYVARKPCTVIWTTVLVCLLLSARLFMIFSKPLPSETEQDKLWVPQDAQAIEDKDRYEAVFSTTYRRNTVMFTTVPDGGNILTSATLSEVARFNSMVNEQLSAYAGTSGDLQLGTVHYPNVCGRTAADAGENTSSSCAGAISGNALELWRRADGTYDFAYTDAQLAAIANSGRGVDTQLFPPDGRVANVRSYLGGIITDASGNITGARSIRLSWLLLDAPRSSALGKAVRAFEDQLNVLVGEKWTDSGLSKGSASDGATIWTSTLVDAYPATEGAFSRELSKGIKGDITSINIAYFIIFIYATCIFSRNSPTQSRALLSAAGIVSIGLSVMIAYGFTTLFVSLNPVVNVLPFILIGIGVDDMFILLFALDAQPTELPAPTRIGRAMGSAGVTITITSLTDVIAFLLGTTSRLPALAGFCTFAAVGIAADYACQITFFAGWMALDVARSDANKVDCCPCFCPSTTVKSSCAPCCCLPVTYGKCAGPSGSGLSGLIKRYYVPFLRKPTVKAVVIVFFVGLTSFSAYSASNLEQNFERRWFLLDDSPMQDTFALQDRYYGGNGAIFYTVTPSSATVDYTSIASQQKLVAIADAVRANPYASPDSLAFWYTTLQEWAHSCDSTVTDTVNGGTCVKRACVDGAADLVYPYCSRAKIVRDANGNALSTPPATDIKYMVDASGTTAASSAPLSTVYLPPSRFWDYLDQFVSDEPLGNLFASEILWVRSQTPRSTADNLEGVVATRMRAQLAVLTSSGDKVQAMQTLREDVAAVDFGTSYVFSQVFLFYEQFAIIRKEAMTNLGLALLAVVLITLFMLADLSATSLVALCIVLTDIDILGMMWYWGLTIDSVSVINLVLAIGLALDYSVHVAHAFTVHQGATRQDRIDGALEETGTPVIHGCVSTFLAVVVLSNSNSYVFRIFFKQFFGIVVFGGAHGLVLLPVLLSLVGPARVVTGSASEIDMHGKKPQLEMTSASEGGSSLPPVPLTPTSGTTTAPPSPPAAEYQDRLQPPVARSHAQVAPDVLHPRCEA